MERQQKIIVLSGITVLSLSYLIYRKVRKNQVFDELIFVISNKGGRNSNKNANALKGLLEQQIRQSNPNKNFIKLNQDKVKSYAEDLNSALAGAGTDEEAISGVFSRLPDKIAVSQVARYYSGLYGGTLYDDLKDDLSDDYYRTYVTDYLNKLVEVRFV